MSINTLHKGDDDDDNNNNCSGLSPGGSGYFTCIKSMKFTNKFKSGRLHEKHVVVTWNLGEPSQHLLMDTGKPRKTCVEEAGCRTF